MHLSIKVKNEIPKKVLAIHDLSCVGRCALTAVIPVLSSMGSQVIPLPTALLSTQTDGYKDYTFLPLETEMPKIVSHWDSLGMSFSAVYSGFLGTRKEIDTVLALSEKYKKESGALIFCDPVMGDDGRLYDTYTEEMCEGMKELCGKADIITPNMTEACLLLGKEYRRRFSDAETKRMLSELSLGGKRSVVLTGVISKTGLIGAVYFDRETGAFGNHFTKKIDASYPGTGDVFAACLLGGMLKGGLLGEAVFSAVSYVYNAVELTYKAGTPAREGVLLENIGILEE